MPETSTGALQLSLARAISGDGEALRAVSATEALQAAGRVAKLEPLLALAAERQGLQDGFVESWRRGLILSAAAWTVLEAELVRIGECLGAAGVPWAPLKGADAATRFFPEPASRPMRDLDILVFERDLLRARASLEHAGFGAFQEGPFQESFLAEEAYNWRAVSPAGVLLEVHFRLWASLPHGAGDEVIGEALPDLRLGPTGYRMRWAHAFAITAYHAWRTPKIERLLRWWELKMIAELDPAAIASEVPSLSRRWGIQLPVVLAADRVSRYWNDPVCAEVAADLRGDLKSIERAVLRRSGMREGEALSGREVLAARFLAGRPSRGGVRPFLRYFWRHPATVAATTAPGGSWPMRRLRSLLSALRQPEIDW